MASRRSRARSPKSRQLFLELQKLRIERELCFQLRNTFVLFGDAPIFRVELRLGAAFLRFESLLAVQVELLSPFAKLRAINALATQKRLNFASLCTSIRFLYNSQFLGCRERPSSTGLRHGLDSLATRARSTVLRRWGGLNKIYGSKMRRFRHVSGPVSALRYTKFRGSAVSRDVGTEGYSSLS
jgi:hypothetical protein